MQPGKFDLPGKWPAVYDQSAASRLVLDFRALGRAESDFTDVPQCLSMLRSLGGNSPYLSELAIRNPPTLLRLTAQQPGEAAAGVLAALKQIPPRTTRSIIAGELRHAKQMIALLTGILDIGGQWPLEKVTAALSDLAETALRLSVDHLLRAAHDKNRIGL